MALSEEYKPFSDSEECKLVITAVNEEIKTSPLAVNFS